MFGIVILLMGRCSVFIQENIEEETIILFAPSDDMETEIVTQTFWWEQIFGAEGYRLQIVTPEFNNIESLLLDTLVSGDKFEMTLYPGIYEWRVRGENNAYVTAWSKTSLSIFESDDLTRQSVRLRMPTDSHFTNNSLSVFKWDTIPNVESYEMEVYIENWGEVLYRDSTGIVEDNIVYTLPEAMFWWGVRALNNKSATLFSTRRLVIDKTAPVKPTLGLPSNNSIMNDSTVNFSWNSSDPRWEVVYDSLLIYEKRDNGKLIKIHEDLFTVKSAKLTLKNDTKYTWKVKSIDQAGNEGVLSEERNFTIEE